MGVIRVVGAGFLGLALPVAPAVANGEDEASHSTEAEHGASVEHGEEDVYGEEFSAHHLREFKNEVAVTYGF